MFRTPAFTVLGALCASLALTSLPAKAEAPKLARTVVLSGLQNPWDIAFTPDGVMLFTEKCRGL